jgi:hypothetical protein
MFFGPSCCSFLLVGWALALPRSACAAFILANSIVSLAGNLPSGQVLPEASRAERWRTGAGTRWRRVGAPRLIDGKDRRKVPGRDAPDAIGYILTFLA